MLNLTHILTVLIGHFEIGNLGAGDLAILPDASHLAVIEAKMFSKLSSRCEKCQLLQSGCKKCGLYGRSFET